MLRSAAGMIGAKSMPHNHTMFSAGWKMMQKRSSERSPRLAGPVDTVAVGSTSWMPPRKRLPANRPICSRPTSPTTATMRTGAKNEAAYEK